MSYIQPNTTILLLKGVGIDSSYQHTIYFDTPKQQTDYFKSKKKHTLTANTYQRPFKNVCRVALLSDVCLDCNYMMFQNDSFGDKWFYAFIEKVEYINNNACEIYYQIDVMQTWMFDYTLRECFVEREHVMSDNLFEHRVEEGLETGEFYNLWSVEIPIEYGALVGTVRDTLPTRPFYEFMYTGLDLNEYDYVHSNSDAQSLHSLLSSFLSGEYPPEHLPLFKLAPLKCIQYDGVKGHEPKNVKETVQVPYLRYMGINYQTLKGTLYTPRNKKLFTNEFYYLNVRNNLGKSQDYNLELFTSDLASVVELEVLYSAYPSPCVLISPKDYNGFVSTNYYEGLSYDVFPPIAWVGNSYTQWDAMSYQTQQAKTGFNTLVSALSSINKIGMASNLMVSDNLIGLTTSQALNHVRSNTQSQYVGNNANLGLAQGVVNGALDMAEAMAQNENKKLKSVSMQGSVGEVAVDFSNNTVKCDITVYGLSYEFAKKIDWYFDIYGYKVNTIKVPNINGRPCWNYVKTVGSNIKSINMPNEDVVAVNKIFDNGITFWKNGDVIGDYADLNNQLPTDEMFGIGIEEGGDNANEQTEE